MSTKTAVQLRVELRGTKPKVWRRILVSDTTTLLRLHRVIQDVFGWLDYHLHEFLIDGSRYGDPRNDEWGEMDLHNEGPVKLRKLDLEVGSLFSYLYDFGDDWEHTVLVEKIFPAEQGVRLPSCTGGRRACPPEDVGGVGGYAEFLQAIADRSHPEHEERIQWVGGAFDPSVFDLREANRRLRLSPRTGRDSGWDVSAEISPSRVLLAASSGGASTHEKAAGGLALRRDVQTLLEYVRDHKVTGTQSTGNLPLKAVAEISAGFVDPPKLEQRFGDTVYRYRGEEDVPAVYFAHVLAVGAALLSGAPGRLWRLTEIGESYLGASAFAQVTALLDAWWYRVNWLLLTGNSVLGDELSPEVQERVRSALTELTVGQPVPLASFVDNLIERVGWTWTEVEGRDTRRALGSNVQDMLVDPMAQFGVLSVETVTERGVMGHIERPVALTLTALGQALLSALDHAE